MADTVCEPETDVFYIQPPHQTTTEELRHDIQSTTTSPTTLVEVFLSESTANVSSSVTLTPRETKSTSKEGTVNDS